MKYLTLISIIALSGCAYFGSLEERTAEELAGVAERYCENTDQDWRDKFRERFNAEFAGSAEITCP